MADTPAGAASVRRSLWLCDYGRALGPLAQNGIRMKPSGMFRPVELVTVALVLAGVCAMTPRAGTTQARAREFDPELLRTGDLIRYRDLSRGDFLADSPPAESGGLHGQLGAATCVFLTTDPETYIRASSRAPDLPTGQVRAEVKGLRFLAYMDRECSWWNPQPLALPDEYILRHEQIHFALFEIAARQLNRRAEELTSQMQAVASDQQSAIREVHRRIDGEMQRAMNEVLARSNDFDRETSRTFRQDRQDWWWRSVTVELRTFDSRAGNR